MEGESVVQFPKNGGKEEIKSQEVEKEQEEVEITISSGEKNEKKENNEQLSPRAVLEISISGTSDSDNSSISSGERSRSFGSSPSPVGEKSSVSDGSGSGGGGEETGQGLRFKNLFDQMKRKSIRRLSAIPLLVGYENLLAKKNIKRKLLSRIRSAEEETIDCHDFVVPKPSWRNFSLDELAQATDNFSLGKFYQYSY